MQSATPKEFLLSVWPLTISLATTLVISVDFSSSPYLDVSVQAVSLIYLCIQYMMYKVCLYGLLHSEISGSMCTYHSPELIAVNHVLLRLPMPRHSPCALFSFTICFLLSWVLLIVNQILVVFYPIKFSLIVYTRSILIFALLLLYSVFKLLFSVPKNRFQ